MCVTSTSWFLMTWLVLLSHVSADIDAKQEKTTLLHKVGEDKTSIVTLDKITDVIEDGWRVNAVKKLSGVIFKDGDGDVLEQTKESRRELERRRLVDDCVAFVKGDAFNMVDVTSCNLRSTTTLNGRETLRIRGRDDLDHPNLMRGGQGIADQYKTSTDAQNNIVRAHHFVMTGDSALTLMNLKLSGAYNGRVGFHNCQYCKGVSSIELLIY
jgi:hypothetical protein